MPAGTLLRAGDFIKDGKHRALLDVYRADSNVLIRADPKNIQAPGSPLGTTLYDEMQELQDKYTAMFTSAAKTARELIEAINAVSPDRHYEITSRRKAIDD